MDTSRSLEDLELADFSTRFPLEFIDSAPSSHLRFSLLVYFAYVSLQLLLASASPHVYSYHRDYYTFNMSESRREAVLDISLSSLNSCHRTVSINCSVFRNSDSRGNADIQIQRAIRIALAEEGKIVRSFNNLPQPEKVHFVADANESGIFPFLELDIEGFDDATLSVCFSGDLNSLTGCCFHWTHLDPTSLRFSRLLRLLTAILIVYFIDGYLRAVQSNPAHVASGSSLILGLMGVIAGNPLSLIFSESSWATFIDCTLYFCYLGFFRLFCLIQLELARGNGEIHSAVVCSSAVFCSIHAFVDGVNTFGSYACLDGNSFPVGIYESLIRGFDILYGGMALMAVRSAFVGAREVSRRRIRVLGGLLFGDILAGWATRLFWAQFAMTIVPFTLKSAEQLAAGALWLFLTRPPPGPEYHEIKLGAKSPENSYSPSNDR
jgi:hypothetical protein